MKWYNILSAPVAGIYGLASMVRNALYKGKVLQSHTVSVPTICVGNLAVGGTGKTPFVEYLIRMLQQDYKVAVLSRGYKRRTRGFVLADATTTAVEIGDEPMQIHTKFPNIPVAVCKDRIEGIQRLQNLYSGLQVVILDDAFQYRRLKCGYYILLTAYDRLYMKDYFLPLGRLRDNRKESLRASAVVVTKCPDTMRPIDQRIVDTTLHLPSFQQLHFSKIIYPAVPEAKSILLVTGIANPEYLLEHVRKSCPSVSLMSFPDHHAFSVKDIQTISQAAEKVEMVLTTEKDYMRLMTCDLPENLQTKIQALPITISLTDEDNLRRALHQYIKENLHIKQ